MRKIKSEVFLNAVVITALLRMTKTFSKDNENMFSGV